MSSFESLIYSEAEDGELRTNNVHKPEVFVLDFGQLPFENMGDAHFELLLSDLYSARADDDSETWYDASHRLNDGADQGRDVILTKDRKTVGVIQCKRYKNNVDLPSVIREICKFFLYAKIKPQIAPDPTQEFRYILAVSNGVTGNLYDFITGEGRERFDNLRNEFEEGALKARNNYKTLKDNPILKNLSKAQLCDIVWQRIDSLETDLLKKDNLSRLVAKYPDLKDVYFSLASNTSTTEALDKINQLLRSQGVELSKDDERQLSHIRTAYITASLGDYSRYNLSLVQGFKLLPFMEGLAKNENSILADNFGSRPVIVNAGSKAVSPSDWFELNKLIKTHPHPLIVFVGCGTVDGSTLKDWTKHEDMLWLDSSWKPASVRQYKAGWCWISTPEQHSCYVLVENCPEDCSFDQGNISLRLMFEDVVVWPVLGNDFTTPISEPKSTLRRIIASQNETNLKNLVLASLHTTNLDKVFGGLSNYHALHTQSTVGIVIGNSERLEYSNGLNCATGIFPTATTTSQDIIRSTPSIVKPAGQVARRSCNGATLLEVNWDREFSVKHVSNFRLVGSKIEEELSPEEIEFNELFQRHPPELDYQSQAKKELEELQQLLNNKQCEDIKGFTYRTRYGVKSGESFSIDDISEYGYDVMQAVQALSYLKSDDSSNWIMKPDIEAHIEYKHPQYGDVNIMAWANHKYSIRQMEVDLYTWAREPSQKNSLIVFANAKGKVNDKKLSHDRYDISSSPNRNRNITEAEEPNNAYIFDLGEIENSYFDTDSLPSDKFMSEILDRRNNLDDK
ncbi:ABC-three component system protein [Vibrio splendidus]|uniref:ABC-three component system protein n=1 Tax=Vibrio splendidus TaxID=29497 RepID=UPI0015E62F8A|nr:ABC-three component system protein [Vibrio splendidus]